MKYISRGSGLVGHTLQLEAKWTLVPPRGSKLLCNHREPFPRPQHTQEQAGTHEPGLEATTVALGREKS